MAPMEAIRGERQGRFGGRQCLIFALLALAGKFAIEAAIERRLDADRQQDALRQLIEAKMKGLTIKARAVSTPAPVVDLMAALKRSLARETPAAKRAANKTKQTKATPDWRQPALLLPLSGGRRRKTEPATSSVGRTSRRKKA
jgi:hypothetical protein